MNRKVFATALLVAFLTQAHAGLPEWVRLEPAGVPTGAIAPAAVRLVADARAQSLWPEARGGDRIDMVDIDGNSIAVLHHYRLDGTAFPDYSTAAFDLAQELPGLADPRNRSRYGYVLTSTRYDRAPVLNYGEGGTELFLTLEQARDLAAGQIGPNPVLSRIYYVWPLSYYEFTSGCRQVVIEAHKFTRSFTRGEFDDYVRRGEDQAIAAAATRGDPTSLKALCADRMRQEWDSWLLGDAALDTLSVYVTERQQAPFYDWSYGCSPTAGTIVAGYLDFGRGYPRCIYDFFWRWSSVEGRWDYQVPWAQREVALAFRTDTTTGGTWVVNIGPGMRSFGSSKGYDWSIAEFRGGGWNDWAWWADTQETDLNRPYVWSVSWQTHSLAAFGYRVPSKDIYVHNTWWAPAAWWHYTDGAYWSTADVTSVEPSGGTDHRFKLLFPRGDTVYNHTGSGQVLWVGRTNTVRWDNHGHPNDSVQIDITTDGGWSWSPLARSLPDTGSYAWAIDPGVPAQNLVRLRLKAFHAGEYMAADGSHGDFKLATVPLPPLPTGPLNGRFINTLPIALTADTVAYVDSFNFFLESNGDTIYRFTNTVPCCTLPDSLIRNNQLYGWAVRAHNSFGWGEYSTRWTFRTRFSGAAESPETGSRPDLAVSTVTRHSAAVRFSLPLAGNCAVTVYDVLGRPVRGLIDGPVPTGRHSLVWDLNDRTGRPVAAGCYFIRLCSQQGVLVRRLQITD